MLGVCAALIVAIGCGGGGAKAPLDVPLFIQRAKVEPALKRHAFCRPTGPVRSKEIYERCKSPGLQESDAYVDVAYDRKGRLVELRRTERFDDMQRATDRWTELVRRRRETAGAESDAAKRATAELGRLPAGTTAWMSWYRQDGAAIASLYLVKPGENGVPRVVEDLFPAPAR